jgi:predicted small secreted protein
MFTLMRTQTAKTAFVLLLLCSAGVLLGACNTTAGAGKDISRAGQAIENSANRNAP